MKLIEMKLNEYLDLLKSNAPAPGGGSVSALAGAQAAGLMMMVADLTIGKEKYAEVEESCKKSKAEAEELYKNLSEAIDKDTEAFNLVAAAFKMPKDSEEEKKARSKAIREGTLVSTEVPYGVMEMAYKGIKIAKDMVGKSNPNAASDLGVAALNMITAMEGAWLNVKINLPGLKDPDLVKKFTDGGEAMVREGRAMAEDVYTQVLKSL